MRHTVGTTTEWLKRAMRSEIQVRWLEPATRIIYTLVVAVRVYVNGVDGTSAAVAKRCHTVGNTTTVAEA